MEGNVVWYPPKTGFHKGATLETLKKFQPQADYDFDPSHLPISAQKRKSMELLRKIRAELQEKRKFRPPGTMWKKTKPLPKKAKPSYYYSMKPAPKVDRWRVQRQAAFERQKIAAAKRARAERIFRAQQKKAAFLERYTRINKAKALSAWWKQMKKSANYVSTILQTTHGKGILPKNYNRDSTTIRFMTEDPKPGYSYIYRLPDHPYKFFAALGPHEYMGCHSNHPIFVMPTNPHRLLIRTPLDGLDQYWAPYHLGTKK